MSKMRRATTVPEGYTLLGEAFEKLCTRLGWGENIKPKLTRNEAFDQWAEAAGRGAG
jgi:hypothetical protein